MLGRFTRAVIHLMLLNLCAVNLNAQATVPLSIPEPLANAESIRVIEYPPLEIPFPIIVEGPITEVVVLIDSTKSMGGYAKNQTKLSIAQWCALNIADAIPDGLPTAFLKLEDSAATIRQLSPLHGEERTALRQSIMHLKASGGDNNKANQGGTLERLFEATRQILQQDKPRKPLVLLVTDGVDCDPYNSFDELNILRESFEKDGFYFHLIGICDNSEISQKLSALSLAAGKNGSYSSVISYLDLPANLSKTYELMRMVREQRSCHFEAEQTTLLTELTRLHHDASQFCQQNECLRGDIRSLCENKKSLLCEIDHLQLQVCSLEKELATQTDRVRQLCVENTELTNRIRELQSELQAARDELARSREELNRLREIEKTVAWMRLISTILLSALCGLLATTLFLLLWLTRCGAERERLQLEVARLNAENCAAKQLASQGGRRGKRGKPGLAGIAGLPGPPGPPGKDGVSGSGSISGGGTDPSGQKCKSFLLDSLETTETKSEWGSQPSNANKTCENVPSSVTVENQENRECKDMRTDRNLGCQRTTDSTGGTDCKG